MSRGFQPRVGSVAARVLDYLQSEGAAGEQLTPDLIVEKFGFRRANITTMLAAAVNAGALVRTKEGRTVFYQLPSDEEPPPPQRRPAEYHDGQRRRLVVHGRHPQRGREQLLAHAQAAAPAGQVRHQRAGRAGGDA